MTTPAYLGEFEQLLLLAVLRLDADAYGVDIARELESARGTVRLARRALHVARPARRQGAAALESRRRHAPRATACRAGSTRSRRRASPRCARRATRCAACGAASSIC